MHVLMKAWKWRMNSCKKLNIAILFFHRFFLQIWIIVFLWSNSNPKPPSVSFWFCTSTHRIWTSILAHKCTLGALNHFQGDQFFSVFCNNPLSESCILELNYSDFRTALLPGYVRTYVRRVASKKCNRKWHVTQD